MFYLFLYLKGSHIKTRVIRKLRCGKNTKPPECLTNRVRKDKKKMDSNKIQHPPKYVKCKTKQKETHVGMVSVFAKEQSCSVIS